MKDHLNRYGVTLLIIFIQFLSAQIFHVKDWVTFFALWTVILLLGGLASIFDLYGGGVQQGYHIGNISITPEMDKPPKQKKSFGSHLTVGNVTMILFSIINLVLALIAYNYIYKI